MNIKPLLSLLASGCGRDPREIDPAYYDVMVKVATRLKAGKPSGIGIIKVAGQENVTIRFLTDKDRFLTAFNNLDGPTLLAILPGTRKDESALHARFSQHKLFMDWFRFDDEIKAFIKEVNSSPDAIKLPKVVSLDFRKLVKMAGAERRAS